MSQPAFVPERREIWYTDGESGFYALRVDKSVWPGATAAQGGACTARTSSRTVRVKKGRATLVQVRVTKGGKAARRALVRLKGPGFSRRARTGSRGRITFRVRARHSGRATASSPLCGGRLRVSASRAPTRRTSARFTG